MTRKNLITLAVVATAFLALLGLAGREDYNDAVVSEMQNNGAYTRYADAHPDMNDAQLIKLYLKDRDK